MKPRLVRGLDYYMRTTFEVVHGSLGAQNSVLGGGRYDGLAEMLDSKVPAPGIGFSIGEDRLVMTVEESQLGRQRSICSSRLWARRRCVTPAYWRAICDATGVSVELAADGKLKRAMELANKLGARFTLIVGDNEIAAGTILAEEYADGRAGNRAARRQSANIENNPICNQVFH